MKFSINKLISRPAFAPISLVALICLFFIESVFTREIFLHYTYESEVLLQWRPYINFLSSVLSCGEFPLWSHNLMSGFPLAAFPHAALFYPPFLVFMVFDFISAFPFFLMLHLGCRVLLIYGLLREWPRSRFASWLGAAAYGLSGCSMHMSGFLMTFDTLTWIPGIYWFSLRLVRGGRPRDFLGMVFFFVLGYLGGDLETLLYSWMILFALLVFVEKAAWPRLIVTGMGLLVGVLVCAAPFLLTLNYLEHSFRESFKISSDATHWNRLFVFVNQLIPLRRGMASLDYVGLLLPVGFLAAFRDRESKRFVRVALVTAGLVMIFILNLWPLGYLFKVLPIFEYSVVGTRLRMLYGLQIMILLLAAGGFERLIKGIDIPSQWLIGGFMALFGFLQVYSGAIDIMKSDGMSLIGFSRLVLILALAVLTWLYLRKASRLGGLLAVSPSMLVMVFVLDLFVLSYLGMPRTDPKEIERPLRHPLLERHDDTDRMHMISLFSMDHDLWKMVSLDRGPGFIFGNIRNGLTRQKVLIGFVNSQLPNPFGYKTVRAETGPLLDFLAVRHLLSKNAPVWGADPMPLDSPFYKSSYMEKGKNVGALPPRSDSGYRMSPGSIWTISLDLLQGDALVMNVEPPHAMAGVSVRVGGAQTGQAVSWGNSEEAGDGQGRRRLVLPGARSGDWYLAIIASPKAQQDVLIASPEIVNEKRPFKKLRDGIIQVYGNRHALDRYGLYTAVAVTPDILARGIVLDPDKFDPSRRLILSPRFAHPGIPEQEARTRRHGDVEVKQFSQNRVVLGTGLKSPAYLSIAETYYPGWRAWVDGEEAKVIRANYAFSAIALPEPGPHRIELRFLPVEFRIGLWVSITSALLIIFITIGIVIRL